MPCSWPGSWSRPDSFPTWGDVTLEFIGEGGVLNVAPFNQKLNVYSDTIGKGTHAGWGDNPNLALIQDFVESVDEQRAPAVTGSCAWK